MKYYQIIFSPTGGTKRVANAITKNWPEINIIDLSVSDDCYSDMKFDSDTLALIAMPSFGGVAPQLALDRLAMIHGNGAKCAVVAVYGNREYEDTLVQIADYSENAGFQVISAVSAIAEHSIARQYAAGRPDKEDFKELAQFGDRILEKAGSDQIMIPNIPGNRPYKTAAVKMIPKTSSKCTGCNLCAQKCPANAISSENPKIIDPDKCISCMRCVSICPVHAKKLNFIMKFMVSKALKKVCSDRKANELFI